MTPETKTAQAIEADPVAAYAKFAGEGDANRFAALIPPHMQGAMVRWIALGIPPADFLRAVLDNDLYAACVKADDANAVRLTDFSRFLLNYAPGLSFGSPEAVHNWQRSGGIVGIQNKRERAA